MDTLAGLRKNAPINMAFEGSFSGGEISPLFWNSRSQGLFPEGALLGGLNLKEDGRALVCADFNNDGAPDVLINTQQGIRFFINPVTAAGSSTPHWVKFSFAPEVSQSVIEGSSLEIEDPMGHRQRVMITSTQGFFSQTPLIAHFGLGKENSIKKYSWTTSKGKKFEFEKTLQANCEYTLGDSGTIIERNSKKTTPQFSKPLPELKKDFEKNLMLKGEKFVFILFNSTNPNESSQSDQPGQSGHSSQSGQLFPNPTKKSEFKKNLSSLANSLGGSVQSLPAQSLPNFFKPNPQTQLDGDDLLVLLVDATGNPIQVWKNPTQPEDLLKAVEYLKVEPPLSSSKPAEPSVGFLEKFARSKEYWNFYEAIKAHELIALKKPENIFNQRTLLHLYQKTSQGEKFKTLLKSSLNQNPTEPEFIKLFAQEIPTP